MSKRIVVVGASRGIGAEVARHFSDAGHRVWGVSRSPAVAREWVQADIGSTEGLEQLYRAVGEEPVEALRLAYEKENVDFTVINPANVATEEVLDDICEGRFGEQTPLPMSDLISAIDWLLSLSSAVDVGDINLMQRFGASR